MHDEPQGPTSARRLNELVHALMGYWFYVPHEWFTEFPAEDRPDHGKGVADEGNHPRRG
jgi:hypothetical protein